MDNGRDKKNIQENISLRPLKVRQLSIAWDGRISGARARGACARARYRACAWRFAFLGETCVFAFADARALRIAHSCAASLIARATRVSLRGVAHALLSNLSELTRALFAFVRSARFLSSLIAFLCLHA